MDTNWHAAKLRAYLAKRGVVPLYCPVCRASNFTVFAPEVMAPFRLDPMQATEPGGGTSTPVLPVMCQSCSHVIFFAWLLIARDE